MSYLLVVILWTVYCALHSFLISVRFTALMTRLLKNYSAFYRLFYVVISLVLLVPLIQFTGEIESPVIMTYDGPLSVARYALMSRSKDRKFKLHLRGRVTVSPARTPCLKC